MKNKGLIIGVLVLLIAVGGYFVWEQNTRSTEDNKKEVVIGAVLPLSGEVASYGIDSKKGIDLAIDLVNSIQKKYNFKVYYQDSKGKPNVAVSALQQIISTHKPMAIIGENTSSATGAMIPIADKNNLLLISPSASAPNLSGLSKYFFRVFPSDDAEGEFICETIDKQINNANVAIIYVNNDYGVGLKNVFEKVAKDKSLKVVLSQGYAPENRDFKAVVSKIKQQKVDAIYIPSYYEDGANLVRQIREQGVKAPIYGCTTHEDRKFIKISGNASEGFQYPISTGYNTKSNSKIVVNFINKFKKKNNGEQPGLVTALGYDCAQLIIDGVLKNGVTTKGIRDYLLSTKNIEGVAGVMNFDSNGNVHKKIILKKVENGEFK